MKNSICVLFVDDEVDIREKLSLSFEMEDCDVLTAASGEEAILVLKNNPQINFIISDIKMPDGDGLFLLKHVKSTYPSLLMVMLTGFTEKSEAELIHMGALAVISKPTDVDSLIQFVKDKFI